MSNITSKHSYLKLTLHFRISPSLSNKTKYFSRLEAGVFEESFDEKIIYDDNMIHELIDAAAEHLGKSIITLCKLSQSSLIISLKKTR